MAIYSPLRSRRLAAKQTELQAHEARMSALGRDLERARGALDREAAVNIDSAIQDESRLRILKHSAKVRTTLDRFRREIICKPCAADCPCALRKDETHNAARMNASKGIGQAAGNRDGWIGKRSR